MYLRIEVTRYEASLIAAYAEKRAAQIEAAIGRRRRAAEDEENLNEQSSSLTMGLLEVSRWITIKQEILQQLDREKRLDNE